MTDFEKMAAWGEAVSSALEEYELEGIASEAPAVINGLVAAMREAQQAPQERQRTTGGVADVMKLQGMMAPAWHLKPPTGWFVFGAHVGEPGPLEFWGEDDGGMPIWERPAQQAPAVEDAHWECNCVPDLGPTHCHACTKAGDGPIVTWAESMHGPVQVQVVDEDALARVIYAAGTSVPWEFGDGGEHYKARTKARAIIASGILQDAAEVEARGLEKAAEEVSGFTGLSDIRWVSRAALITRAQQVREGN